MKAPSNLWVGELQAGDGEHHLSCSHEEILRNLPGHVDGVGAHVHHWLDAVLALRDRNGYQDVLRQSKTATFELCCDSKYVYQLHLLQKWNSAWWSWCKSCRSQIAARRNTLVLVRHLWSRILHWCNKKKHQSERGHFSQHYWMWRVHKHLSYFPCGTSP